MNSYTEEVCAQNQLLSILYQYVVFDGKIFTGRAQFPPRVLQAKATELMQELIHQKAKMTVSLRKEIV